MRDSGQLGAISARGDGLISALPDPQQRTKRTDRAALSYSSKRGIARSFIFLGTARTSFLFRKMHGQGQTRPEDKKKIKNPHTSFRHLNKEQLLALFRLGNMRRDKRVLLSSTLDDAKQNQNVAGRC